MHTIYALVDPRDSAIRYVGRSVSLLERIGQHFLNRGSNSDLAAWMKELGGLGLIPRVEKLEENIPTVAEAKRKERVWIRRMQREGAHLLNRQNNAYTPRPASAQKAANAYRPLSSRQTGSARPKGANAYRPKF